jgi:uncharacterized protein YciI
MFVAISEYLLDADEVDRLRPDHKAWLAEASDAGRLLVSGRQNPPSGGVLVFHAEDREEADAFIATDPYVVGGAARYELTEFTPRQGTFAPRT